MSVSSRRQLIRRECIFFCLTSYVAILACSLISTIHTILILDHKSPPCPPANPIHHVALLAKVAFDPPLLPSGMLRTINQAEAKLEKGSKSFHLAKLAFGRELRLGLVCMYAWCRVTVSAHKPRRSPTYADTRTTG